MRDWLSSGNGGEATMSSYVNLTLVNLQEHLTWMKSLPDYLVEPEKLKNITNYSLLSL